MPLLKLRKHPASTCDDDILINPSDCNGIKLYDVVELKPPKGGNETNRILLQVRRWPDPNSPHYHANCVSIKDTVINNHLQTYGDVLVTVVDKKDVVVDSIEICFSNAYLARSYMWGLRNHLNNRCVYQHQRLDYLHINSQIYEIWSQGNQVTSGYVDDETKIVFRSASSLVYLFIQMSSEMWDYDINGDLYCEKAVNGFLTDLFETWRHNDCSHDITIVLFSRTYYDAESLDEFPKEMRECLQVDYRHRYYEDCYRVAFQNDRFDLHDWNDKLTTLKSIFNQYQKEVIDRHQDKYDTKIPRAYNSSASQGNFLEVLNMSLNVFEKHYFDRSFDRTGQLSVVVSPGVGVFEVDFEMTNLTKQRIIDNGIGSDLVCLGEQPLHTVPLLKFNSRSSSHSDSNLAMCDVYNMPHWINLSFYSSQNQVHYSSFVPRIKLPTIHTPKPIIESINQNNSTACSEQQPTRSNLLPTSPRARRQQQKQNGSGDHNGALHTNAIAIEESNAIARRTSPNQNARAHIPRPANAIPDLVDYDDYDAQVFKPNALVNYNCDSQSSSVTTSAGRTERSALSDLDANVECLNSDTDDDFMIGGGGVGSHARNRSANVQRRSSDLKNFQDYANRTNMRGSQLSENMSIGHPHASHNQHASPFVRMSLVDSYLNDLKMKPESADDLSVRGYNMQSSRLNRLTSRPKALINPFDPSHMTIKLTPNRRRWTHVFPQGPTGTFMQQHHYQPRAQKNALSTYNSPPVIPENEAISGTRKRLASSSNAGPNRHQSNSPNGAGSGHDARHKSVLVSNDTIRFAWCASGEQEWTPAITTGVDWKSLTMPACLPLTTDFFPSKTSLQNDYVIGEYNIDASCIHSRYTLIEVYRELVCQRLQKGFQIILLPRQSNSSTSGKANESNGDSSNRNNPNTVISSSSIRHMSARVSSSSSLTSASLKSSSRFFGISSSNKSSAHNRTSQNSTNSPLSTSSDGQQSERTEYIMSIGRIFHKLSLNGNTITITQYRPRHPYPTIKIDYCYRFRAPFHNTYIQSWVHFKSEKLENYGWNYLDNYICARGESFELRNSLKFWRFRILILPSGPNLDKLSHEQHEGAAERHDLYPLEFSETERASLLDSFAKLLEIINKTRRASACRTSNMTYSSSLAPSPSPGSTAALAPVSPTPLTRTSTSSPMTSTSTSASHSCTNNSSSVNALQFEGSPTRLNVQINANNSHRRRDEPCADESLAPEPTDLVELKSRLRFVSINMDIDSALRDASRAEWVHVQYHNYYDINQAFELVIKWMVASGAGIAEMVQGWSRKAGGSNSSVHVVPIPWEPFAMPHSGKADPLRCPIGIELRFECLPDHNLLSENQVIALQAKILRRFGFITFHDLISTENIERQYVHISGFAFVALPDVINPNDDLDSRYIERSNDIDVSNASNESGKPQQQHQQPILVSRDAINKQPQPNTSTQSALAKSSSCSSTSSASGAAPVFKMLDNNHKKSARRLEHQDTISSPHEEYITRHIGGARETKANRLRGDKKHIEFIWSWNYMLTKRWRSASTQHESYAVSLMQDFRRFCYNDGNRLVDFYAEVRETL